MAKEIQKPPYEDRAVPPKVLPTAISLFRRVSWDVKRGVEMPQKHIPHAGQELNKATIAKRKTDDDGIDTRQTPGVQVDQTEDECGQGEGRETERSRVGEFATLDGLVETWLEFTPKGGKHSTFVRTHVSQRAIAEASGIRSSGLFLVAHASSGFVELLLVGGRVAVGRDIVGCGVEVGWLFGGRHGGLRCVVHKRSRWARTLLGE